MTDVDHLLDKFEIDDLCIEEPHSGELITLIHGWPDDLRLWDGLVERLLATGKYRCLRMTLPGFGNRMGKQGRPVVDPNFHRVASIVASVIKHQPTSRCCSS